VFNIGPEKLMLVLVVALIVLGPDKLPNAARQIGRYVNDFRRISQSFQDELRGAIDLANTSPPQPGAGDTTGGAAAAPADTTTHEPALDDILGADVPVERTGTPVEGTDTPTVRADTPAPSDETAASAAPAAPVEPSDDRPPRP
jgi:Tat protein translocase TatB subunit